MSDQTITSHDPKKSEARSVRVVADVLHRTSGLLAKRDECALRVGFGRHIWGWYVEPHPDGGVIVVATDGRAIGIMLDKAGYAKAGCFLYATEGLKAAITPPRPLIGFCEGDTVEVEPREIEVPADVYATEAGVFVQHKGDYEDTDQQFSLYHEMAEHGSVWAGGYRLIAETMDWRRIPDSFKAPSPSLVYLDPTLLASFALVKDSGWFVHTQADEVGVYRVSHPSVTDFVGFIMPCRRDGDAKPIDPDWFTKARAQSSEATHA